MKLRIPHAWLLIGPYVLFALGAMSNFIVMAANGAQMPVLTPGGCSIFDNLKNPDDIFHSCMTHASHLKFLADWIVIQGGVASPGDFALYACEYAMIPAFWMWMAWVIRDYTETPKK